MQSHWANRFRRHYYIHARGRMLDHSETLESVGLVDGELIYLLPQPDAQLGVLEQNPAYPEVKPYLGQGLTQLMLTLFAVLLFSFLWGMALVLSKVFGPPYYPVLDWRVCVLLLHDMPGVAGRLTCGLGLLGL